MAELNNHYDITIDYHHRDDGKYRVVGVLVSPVSRAQKVNEKGVIVPSGGAMVLKGNEQVVYSYSVNWQVNLNISKQEEVYMLANISIL